MKLLMIDNYDSFTYNIVQYFGELGAEVEVFRNDEITLEEIAARAPDRLVVSPGPCAPTSLATMHGPGLLESCLLHRYWLIALIDDGLEAEMAKIVDLSSATVPQPPAAMRAAMQAAPLGDDVFGDDPSVNALQEKIA